MIRAESSKEEPITGGGAKQFKMTRCRFKVNWFSAFSKAILLLRLAAGGGATAYVFA